MANIPYFVAGLSDADMVWLLSVGRLRMVHPGQRLIEAGRAVEQLYFVIDGALAVVGPDGVAVATLGAGDVVGEMSFVEQRAPSASVRVEARTALLAVPRSTILERFEEEPRFAARFYRALATFLSTRLRVTTARSASADGVDEEAREAERVGASRLARLKELVLGKAG